MTMSSIGPRKNASNIWYATVASVAHATCHSTLSRKELHTFWCQKSQSVHLWFQGPYGRGCGKFAATTRSGNKFNTGRSIFSGICFLHILDMVPIMHTFKIGTFYSPMSINQASKECKCNQLQENQWHISGFQDAETLMTLRTEAIQNHCMGGQDMLWLETI